MNWNSVPHYHISPMHRLNFLSKCKDFTGDLNRSLKECDKDKIL